VRQLFTSLAPIWDVVQNQLDVKFSTPETKSTNSNNNKSDDTLVSPQDKQA